MKLVEQVDVRKCTVHLLDPAHIADEGQLDAAYLQDVSRRHALASVDADALMSKCARTLQTPNSVAVQALSVLS